MGLPDISQIVPLASVLKVSTDVLFGIAGTSESENAWSIVSNADSVKEYGNYGTYLNAYDILSEGLKRYPTNLIIMNNCMSLGLSLSMSDNVWSCCEEQVEKIISETIRQADFIATNSKNINDILSATQALVLLYCRQKKYGLAAKEAKKFPVRPDLTMYSNMAAVWASMGDHENAAICLCTELDYSLQTLGERAMRLGMEYFNNGSYEKALEVYESFLVLIGATFKDGYPPPYHDFDCGDCYLLLAQAYLATGQREKAMDAVEGAIVYYLDLLEKHSEERICRSVMLRSPLVRRSENIWHIDRDIFKKKLFSKLSEEAIQPLRSEPRFEALLKAVKSVS